MKLRILSTYMAAVVVAAAGVLVPTHAFAAIVSLYDVDGMHVNRVLGHGGNLDNTYHDEVFSTYGLGGLSQTSYASITNSDLLTALSTALGPLGGGQAYSISSATFFAGTGADSYADTSSVYTSGSYDPTTLTWNNQPNGGGTPSGTLLDTGSVSVDTTTWDVSGGVDTVSDTFLFWTAGPGGEFTDVTNGDVHLEVEASIINIPEPSAFVLLSITGVIGLVVRRRRRD